MIILGKVPSPRFGLIQERSFNGAPSVSIAFPDGYKDTLVLERYYANEEERMERTEACRFIGHLANEPEACVAMTGCVGSDDVQFTIMSAHATESAMFKWTKEGDVEIIESPFKVQNYFEKTLIVLKDFKFHYLHRMGWPKVKFFHERTLLQKIVMNYSWMDLKHYL